MISDSPPSPDSIDGSNIADLVWKQACDNADHVALREGDQIWSYSELWRQVTGAMNELEARGVKKGDHVLVVLPTSSEFIFILYALHALGAVSVTVNPLSTNHELQYFLTDAECSMAIGWHTNTGPLGAASKSAGVPVWTIEPHQIRPGLIERKPAVIPDGSAAVLIYTSGTTGKPKGAVLTHANVRACGQSFEIALGLGADDRMGTALPLFHVFGQAAVTATVFAAGATLSLLSPFSGSGMLDLAVRHKLTAMAGVPTMWNEMLNADTSLTSADFANLKIAVSGGAAMPMEVALAFQVRFGAQILEGYGLSESTGGASFNQPGVAHKQGSVGRAVEGTTLRIVRNDFSTADPGEVGEVAIAGPLLMKEYWKRPEATADTLRDGWLLTGDVGRMDEDGYLWIVDRKKDLIIRGGYNVYPREIEEVLYGHPSVHEAAVIGIPDERLGEEIAAVLSFREGKEIDIGELRTWLSERLTLYKVPRVYHVVSELPKGATGKILKRALEPTDVVAQGVRMSARRGRQ